MPIRQAVAAAVILNPRTGAQGAQADSDYLAQERNASQKICEDLQAHCRKLLSPYKVAIMHTHTHTHTHTHHTHTHTHV